MGARRGTGTRGKGKRSRKKGTAKVLLGKGQSKERLEAREKERPDVVGTELLLLKGSGEGAAGSDQTGDGPWRLPRGSEPERASGQLQTRRG